jgi:hypothetical protein
MHPWRRISPAIRATPSNPNACGPHFCPCIEVAPVQNFQSSLVKTCNHFGTDGYTCHQRQKQSVEGLSN